MCLSAQQSHSALELVTLLATFNSKGLAKCRLCKLYPSDYASCAADSLLHRAGHCERSSVFYSTRLTAYSLISAPLIAHHAQRPALHVSTCNLYLCWLRNL